MTNLVRGKLKVRHSHGKSGTATVDAEFSPSGLWAISHAWRHGKPNRSGWLVYHVPTGLAAAWPSGPGGTTKDEARRMLVDLERHGFWRAGALPTEEFVAAAEAGGARSIVGGIGGPAPHPSQRVPLQIPLLPEIDDPLPFRRRQNPVQIRLRGSMSSAEIRKLETMEGHMRYWQDLAQLYYERGEQTLAEDADARADALAEHLESYVAEIDDADVFEERLAWDSVGVQQGMLFSAPPELDPDKLPPSAEEEILRIFDDYVMGLGNFQFVDGVDTQRLRDEELASLLRQREAEGFIVAPPGASDELLVEAARQVWEDREVVRAAYKSRARAEGWRRGVSSPRGGERHGR